MSDETEAELVRKVGEGDQSAFQAILDRQLASVSRYIARMLGDPAEAEDVTQEVFLRLWTNARKYDADTARLSTWLHNIAHNLCIDHFRKQGRIVLEEPPQTEPSGEEPEAGFMASLVSNDIKTGMMQLPERQRSAIIMCHYQGLSNKEAAEILDVSVDALESLLARGRRSLKTILKAHIDD